ncbi:hypothetical protein FM112_01860 [Gulosibacter sp. 10]|nr:hypothetical protein FM112_01860 [Gulosibacter sp. 10]
MIYSSCFVLHEQMHHGVIARIRSGLHRHLVERPVMVGICIAPLI